MSETRPNHPDWHVSHGDHFKSLFEYFRHISTLSTGSILLIATFLEKLFRQPVLSWCVTLSVTALFISLCASMVVYSVLVLNYPRNDRAAFSGGEFNIVFIGLMATWVAFLVGIGAMAIFFLVNWAAHS